MEWFVYLLRAIYSFFKIDWLIYVLVYSSTAFSPLNQKHFANIRAQIFKRSLIFFFNRPEGSLSHIIIYFWERDIDSIILKSFIWEFFFVLSSNNLNSQEFFFAFIYQNCYTSQDNIVILLLDIRKRNCVSIKTVIDWIHSRMITR